MLMADLGADVIKVEDPRMGDYIRWWPPKIGGNSGFHVVLNRNKRSLTLNLKSPEAKVIFEKLAADADVVLEGFRPGVMAKLGLGLPRPRADKSAPGLLRHNRLRRPMAFSRTKRATMSITWRSTGSFPTAAKSSPQ